MEHDEQNQTQNTTMTEQLKQRAKTAEAALEDVLHDESSTDSEIIEALTRLISITEIQIRELREEKDK